MSPKVDLRILEAIGTITAKRPKTVLDHILKHGFITTEDLESKYGYNHPPRAARDVREAGIPLETFRVKGSDGRSIAAYRLGDPAKVVASKLAGRRVYSKALRETLYSLSGGRCAICQTPYEARYLSIDHRVPYEIAGDDVVAEESPSDFMMLCASCQRSKSWSCEHCSNWAEVRDGSICLTCYWADPDAHTHLACTTVRRLDVSWIAEETSDYEVLITLARKEGVGASEYVKQLLRSEVERAGGPKKYPK